MWWHCRSQCFPLQRASCDIADEIGCGVGGGRDCRCGGCGCGGRGGRGRGCGGRGGRGGRSGCGSCKQIAGGEVIGKEGSCGQYKTVPSCGGGGGRRGGGGGGSGRSGVVKAVGRGIFWTNKLVALSRAKCSKCSFISWTHFSVIRAMLQQVQFKFISGQANISSKVNMGVQQKLDLN